MIYIATGFTGTTYPLKHGRLCWDAQVGTITASTSAAGFAAVNAANVRTDSAWRPTALPASWENVFGGTFNVGFVGIAKHDLGSSGATVSIEYFDDGVWVAFPGAGAIEPEDDSAILLLTAVTACEGVRVRVLSGFSNPTISVIRAGRAQEMPRPFTWTGQPITEGDVIRFENTISVTGNWLGRSVASDGLQFSLSMQNVSEEWRQGEFARFKAYANGQDATFFVAARPSDYPKEVAYAWATDVVTANRDAPNKRLSTAVTINCQGLRPAMR